MVRVEITGAASNQLQTLNGGDYFSVIAALILIQEDIEDFRQFTHPTITGQNGQLLNIVYARDYM